MRDHMMKYCFMLFLGCLLLGYGSAADSEEVVFPPPAIPPGDPIAAVQPPIKMIAPGIFAIAECKIYKNENRVEFPAAVNMSQGLLEYLLVGSNGKLHESLLKTDVEPYSLQIALLLVGLEGSTNPLASQGEMKVPEGNPVKITVKWKKEGGGEQGVPIEQWVKLQGKTVKDMPWVFTGSVVREGIFLAQVEKSMIALFHDPVAMIDHRLAEGSSDEAWFVDSEKVPAVGTEVMVVIEKAKK